MAEATNELIDRTLQQFTREQVDTRMTKVEAQFGALDKSKRRIGFLEQAQ